MSEEAKAACRNCDGVDWVCENHTDRPWAHLSNHADACQCGAGSPCPVCQFELAAAPLTHALSEAVRALSEQNAKYASILATPQPTETQRIVAWLRERSKHYFTLAQLGRISPSWFSRATDFAEMIERGEHRAAKGEDQADG